MPVLSSSSTSTSPDASTARPDIASTLRWTSRSMPGDADRREQGADRRRDQRDEQRDQHGRALRRAGVDRERPQRHDGGEEGDREAGEQDVERDLVRRLAALGALDERDHPVEERLPRLLGDLDDEPVGEQLRPARDRRAVAARLADHRCRLAGDRRLVDGADALDHLAVGRDDLSRLDDDDVAALQLRAPAPRAPSRRRAFVVVRVARSAFACALPRPSAIASAKFAKSTVSQSQNATTPVNQSKLFLKNRHGRDHRAELDDEDDRVVELDARVELDERVLDRRER